MNPAAPHDWTNVDSTDPDYDRHRAICADLITGSTLTSGANGNTKATTLKNQIEKGRTALWLRNDELVTVVFHSLDGPTASPAGSRTPKFVVCAGVDPSAPAFDPSDHGGPTYRSIRDAVKKFAHDNGNQNAARLYLLLVRGTTLVTGDRIKPFFDYACQHELDASESPGGAPEDYTAAQGSKVRWPNLLTTFLLKIL
jgi:hypothetical protein